MDEEQLMDEFIVVDDESENAPAWKSVEEEILNRPSHPVLKSKGENSGHQKTSQNSEYKISWMKTDYRPWAHLLSKMQGIL